MRHSANALSLRLLSAAWFLVATPAFADEPPAAELVTIVVTVTGIKPVPDSYILVLIGPTAGNSLPIGKLAEVEMTDCPEDEDMCGMATITSDPVEPDTTYKLTVCHKRQAERDCPVGDDGRTIEAGEILDEIDPSVETEYTISLEDEY